MSYNTVGIPEGTEIREELKCQCQWVTLLCFPPIRKLKRKCDYCKELEGIPIEAEPPTESVGLDTLSDTSGGKHNQVLAITDKGVGFVDADDD